MGLWAAQRSFGPEVKGPLTLREVDGKFRAEISGYSVAARTAEGEIRFEIPGDRGYFRGTVSADRQRMDIYRRIAIAEDARELKTLKDELADLFGPVPSEVSMLLDLSEIRLLAGKRAIKSLVVTGNDLVFTMEKDASVSDFFARAPGRISIPDPRSVYVRLEKNYFEPTTLMAILRKLFRN